MKLKLSLLTLCLLLFAGNIAGQKASELVYVDASELTLINKGFDNTELEYSRLPLDLKDRTREAVWSLGLNSAGLAVRFSSNAHALGARWTLLNNFHMNHMAATGIRGIDLYTLEGNTWKFIGTAQPNGKESSNVFVRNMDGSDREYLAYLPLYDGVTKVEFGADSGAVIAPPKKKHLLSAEKPYLFYGTSITQGGCVSRPGLAYPSQVALKLDCDFVNLGFSGSAKAETEIIEYLKNLDMSDKIEGRKELIAGINHMAWLLEIKDKNGVDLYPEIKSKIDAYLADPEAKNKVRIDYIKHFGYYCTESSEHNAEYNMFYIKSKYPELIERYNIPLDEYPRRCVNQINGWRDEWEYFVKNGLKERKPSNEYAARIMESVLTNQPYEIGGNVLNTGHLISNLPEEACVEVPCLVNGSGIHPCHVGALPLQCAAMNMTNINTQLLTIEAAVTLKKDHIYQAAMLDPHTGSELDIDTIKKMVDDLIEAHGDYLPKYH